MVSETNGYIMDPKMFFIYLRSFTTPRRNMDALKIPEFLFDPFISCKENFSVFGAKLQHTQFFTLLNTNYLKIIIIYNLAN